MAGKSSVLSDDEDGLLASGRSASREVVMVSPVKIRVCPSLRLDHGTWTMDGHALLVELTVLRPVSLL